MPFDFAIFFWSDCALCRCILSDRDVMKRLTGISAQIFPCSDCHNEKENAAKRAAAHADQQQRKEKKA